MRLTVRKKILLGFGIVIAIMLVISISNLLKINYISDAKNRLTELRFPTVLAGAELTDGIHLSLAGLRAYMILGKDPVLSAKFKSERQAGWTKIEHSLSEMKNFSKQWTDPNNIKRLSQMEVLIEEFRQAQMEIEDIAHKPENIPSLNMLLIEAAPRASKILEAITFIIDEESNLPATQERKQLLKLLADSRGSFAVGLANIRAFLLTGDSNFSDVFKEKWTINENRYLAISSMDGLFTASQKNAWNTYKTLRSEFSSLPTKMFSLRSSKEWNIANHWLGSKAAPKADAILGVLKEMKASQDKLATIDQEEFSNETNSMSTNIVVGSVILIFLGVIISLWVSNTICIPLQAVVQRAKAIEQGDLSLTDLDLKGNDELTELTLAINSMNKNLRVIVEELISSSHQLSSSAEELSAITIDTGSKINEQQSQTEQVSAAMNEMSTSVQDIAGNISSTAEAVKAANTETRQGRQLVNQVMDAINQLAKRIEKESLLIIKLEQDSTEINSVIAVIRGVAEQTNLLALNAAIEAARAGEQGRGFAVVADEVRSLASRTQDSTEEINQVVEKLQTGSREAVQAMNSSLSEAKSAVDQASQARTSLEAISSAVDKINDMSSQIASTAEEQHLTTEEINRNITAIADMSYETTEGAKQTTIASEELAQLASSLYNISSKFKI